MMNCTGTLLALMLAGLVACGTVPGRSASTGLTAGSAGGTEASTAGTTSAGTAGSAAVVADTPDVDLPSLTGPPAAAARDNAVGVVAAGGPLLPSGWEPWILHPSKTLTTYRLERRGSGLAMRADADSSASGLLTMMRADPTRRPFLEWRWRVDELISGADNTDRHAEDAPVRIVLAFDGDKSSLPMKDRLFFEQMRLFSGRDLPYATLMYIWENNKPVGTVIRNPNTDRVRKIVVASGASELQRWCSFRRNIVEDYKMAYGMAPGKLVAVAILTDTDNTKQSATAWYGDIKLLRH